MKTRTDLINHLIKKHDLKRYLEIGLQNADQNFNKIDCEYKVSVDPDPKAKATFCMTSDKFFEAGLNPRLNNFLLDTKFDLIFIDGLHTAEQVKKDFENALKVLSRNGFIVLHDLLPETYERTLVPRPTPTGSWNGSCWKFAIGLDFNSTMVVNIDNGCGVYSNKAGRNATVYRPIEMAWDEFNMNRNKYMNIVSWEEFTKL